MSPRLNTLTMIGVGPSFTSWVLWVTDTSSDLRVHTQRNHPFQHGSGRVGLESGERDESAVLTAHGESGFGSDTL